MKKVPGDDPVRSELRYHANAMVARSADARGSDSTNGSRFSQPRPNGEPTHLA